MEFTAFYQDVYDELSHEDGFNEEWLRDFVEILPVASIVSANTFDPSMYVHSPSREVADAKTDTGTIPPAPLMQSAPWMTLILSTNQSFGT